MWCRFIHGFLQLNIKHIIELLLQEGADPIGIKEFFQGGGGGGGSAGGSGTGAAAARGYVLGGELNMVKMTLGKTKTNKKLMAYFRN